MPPRRTTPTGYELARNLRKEPTPAERKLWAYLRGNKLNGVNFRRQHAIGNFIIGSCRGRVPIGVSSRCGWVIVSPWMAWSFGERAHPCSRGVRENMSACSWSLRLSGGSSNCSTCARRTGSTSVLMSSRPFNIDFGQPYVCLEI